MHKNPAFVVANIESFVLLILVWVPTPSAAQALEQAFVGCLRAVRCGQDVEDVSQIWKVSGLVITSSVAFLWQGGQSKKVLFLQNTIDRCFRQLFLMVSHPQFQKQCTSRRCGPLKSALSAQKARKNPRRGICWKERKRKMSPRRGDAFYSFYHH